MIQDSKGDLYVTYFNFESIESLNGYLVLPARVRGLVRSLEPLLANSFEKLVSPYIAGSTALYRLSTTQEMESWLHSTSIYKLQVITSFSIYSLL